jgi:hypothetical protein
MEALIKQWQRFAKKYQPLVVKLLLAIALLTSILININLISPSEGWIFSAILLALLLFSDQVDAVHRRLTRPPLQVFPSQQDPTYDVEMYSFLAEDKSKEAMLLEFSTVSIRFGLLQHLVKRGYRIRLLLCHPEAAPNEYQRNRIKANIGDLLSLRVSHQSQEDFEIRCYRQRAALRGRKFGKRLISVGWYTYGTQRIEKGDYPEKIKQVRRPQEIDGHYNVLINADLPTDEGRALETMFDRVFEDLWTTATPADKIDIDVSQSQSADGRSIK